MVNSSTIIAQSTPQGSGAIALLRISGPDAVSIADGMARFRKTKKQLVHEPSHTIHFGDIVGKDDKIIDQVVFLLMRGPKNFTGEDTVEITCHNNSFIIKAIIARAIELGACVAQRGEFTRRALENGKLDLVKAEAINELIHAQTELALQKSLAQLTGSLSEWISAIENRLVESLALCNASFEFIEEETNFAPEIISHVTTIMDQIAKIQQSHSFNAQIRSGVKIAIVGIVNAGKSSLFNRILGHDRAIVTPIAGTTRDTVEATIDRGGINWTLIDTAGIRETSDPVENEGIRRSLEEAKKADIILLVSDGTIPLVANVAAFYHRLLDEFNDKIIQVETKSDLVLKHDHVLSKSALPISNKTGAGHAELIKTIENRVNRLFDSANAPFLINQRHHAILIEIQAALTNVKKMLERPTIHYEIIAHELQGILERISNLSGKSISQAAMDKIFQDFCIGK